MAKSKIAEIVEKQIIEKLEEGVCPWVKGWAADGGAPRNLDTCREYNGINRLFTMMQGYSSPYWITYKQAKKFKGNVIKGEKGTKILFAQTVEKENTTGEMKRFPVFRYYAVFNLEQCEDIKIPKKAQEEIDLAVSKLENRTEIDYGVLTDYIAREKTLSLQGGQPSYAPKKDIIRMPSKESFISMEEYVGTLCHECIHSTGHWMRLDRGFKNNDNNKEPYAKEELIAEIGSAFLCAMLGVEKVLDNQVAYIAGWKKKIKDTSGIVVSAASLAQKAVDYIKHGKGELDAAI